MVTSGSVLVSGSGGSSHGCVYQGQYVPGTIYTHRGPDPPSTLQDTWNLPGPGMWNLPGPGIEPVFPALADELLASEPPGKSRKTPPVP